MSPSPDTFRRCHLLPPELAVMPINLRLMELVGLWGPPDQFWRFLTAFGWGTAVILFPKAVLGMGSRDFDKVAKGVAEFIFEFTIFVSLVIFVANRGKFERAIDGLREIFHRVAIRNRCTDCYDFICEQNLKIEKFVKFYIVYCMFGPFVFCVPPVTSSYVQYFSSRKNNSEPLSFELPMEQEFYGLQIRSNFVHYHAFVALSVSAYCVCSYFLIIKACTMFLMIRYSALTSAVEVSDLAEVVELHRLAYNVTSLVESICHLPLAIQFLTCVLFWCLTMVYVSTNIDYSLFNVMVLFWLSLIETFGYSYLGSQLMEEANGVSKAIYDLPWYEHSVELQRYYRLMLQRVQRPTRITGMRFFAVELGTFGSVVNSSYSYYLVLKDALKKL
ncbi:hypothetical protein pipiens_006315 [Culex pipiens pipiens]|uniref:Odorant receptor n=1 Tax=Culex pipiens pipiens TaxID=38569 RepID=A0ABD1DQY6_CULPP